MSTALRRAIYGKLAGDATLNALLATPPSGYSKSIFYQQAPGSATYPLVIISKQAGTPSEAFGDPSALETDIWLVKAIDNETTADTAEAIQARVSVLLNDPTGFSISGATLCYLRRQSDVDYGEEVDGVFYSHSGSLYRVVTD